VNRNVAESAGAMSPRQEGGLQPVRGHVLLSGDGSRLTGRPSMGIQHMMFSPHARRIIYFVLPHEVIVFDTTLQVHTLFFLWFTLRIAN
jgi:hypothetical protein